MNLAIFETEGIGDDSLPRATLRSTRQSALETQINSNISLMSANRCAPYPHPISENAYMAYALACHVAIERTPASSEGQAIPGAPPACDRSKWRRIGR
jgi:hypothetical protein